jgi:hypothetical protein
MFTLYSILFITNCPPVFHIIYLLIHLILSKYCEVIIFTMQCKRKLQKCRCAVENTLAMADCVPFVSRFILTCIYHAKSKGDFLCNNTQFVWDQSIMIFYIPLFAMEHFQSLIWNRDNSFYLKFLSMASHCYSCISFCPPTKTSPHILRNELNSNLSVLSIEHEEFCATRNYDMLKLSQYRTLLPSIISILSCRIDLSTLTDVPVPDIL